MTTFDEKALYTLKEASEILNYSPKTLRRYIKEGRLEAFQIHRSFRISASALKRAMKREMRRSFESDMGLIDSSYKTLYILGINALSPLHRGFEVIKEKMMNGVNLRVLLLDPDSKAFKNRAEWEADGKPEYTFSRLKSEFDASLALCRCIADSVGTDSKCGKIEVSLYDSEPECSMIIIDYLSEKGIYWACNYNPYPVLEHTRGVSGRTYFVGNEPEEEKSKKKSKIKKIFVSEDPYELKTVEEYKEKYSNLFTSSRVVEIYDAVDSPPA